MPDPLCWNWDLGCMEAKAKGRDALYYEMLEPEPDNFFFFIQPTFA